MTEQKLAQIAHLVGNTPLLEIHYLYQGRKRRLFAKAEYYNLTGSIKDRIAYYILRESYRQGLIKPTDTIVEATSGNTGISFAAFGAYLKQKVIIYMPDWMSAERIDLMKSFGAELQLVARAAGGFVGAVQAAEKRGQESGIFLPRQFSNQLNADAHYYTTGTEIIQQLEQLGLQADAFVAGVGTGGTIMGAGQRLREHNPACKIYPLEPQSSPTLSTGKQVGSHRIQGISDEFVPELIHLNELADILAADDGDAINLARLLAAQLGIGVGISSGANLIGAIKAQDLLGDDAVIVTVLADDNKKYLSTDYAQAQPIKKGHYTPQVEFLACIAHRCYNTHQ